MGCPRHVTAMNERQVYRFAFPAIFLWFVLHLWCLDLVLAWAVFGVEVADTQWFGHMNGITWASLCCAALVLFAYKSEVSRHGLVSYKGLLGERALLPWSEIEEVRRRSLLGLPFLRVQGRDGTVLWVGRLLHRQEEFDLLMTAVTRAGHPLRAAVGACRGEDPA